MHRILVAEDENNIREPLCGVLKKSYSVKSAQDGGRALEMISKEGFDLLITDLKMPNADGIELLEAYKKTNPGGMVIVITAFSSIQNAVEAMKAGADEYVPKPFSLDEIELKVKNLLRIKDLSLIHI